MPKTLANPLSTDNDAVLNRTRTPAFKKRAHSLSPVRPRSKSPNRLKNIDEERRCQSLSPSNEITKRPSDPPTIAQQSASAPETMHVRVSNSYIRDNESTHQMPQENREPAIPQCVLTKIMRALATKKREFFKLRKLLISQQNNLLEQFAHLKDLEMRAGVKSDDLGDVRILSVNSWPAHDLLLLVRSNLNLALNSEISGVFGPQVLQQLHAQLSRIPEEMVGVAAEIMAQRMELLHLIRGKRGDRGSYSSNLEWRSKNNEFDNETERLHRLVAGTAENLKAKINYSLEIAKIPWLDRDALFKKIDRLQKDNLLLQHRAEENTKKDKEKGVETKELPDGLPTYEVVCEELTKERAAREALKEVVSAAESMLRVARARIATLERQLKETRAELEVTRRKHKDLEQLVNRIAQTHNTYRHRETSYDTRSKKLLEVSKTGEMTIEALSRQRDALELRVRELREQADQAERAADLREAERRAHWESLQVKVAEQEKIRSQAENHVAELENRIKELEEQLQAMRERSVRLVDVERRRCLEYLPSKESEPSDRETEIWKELQVTRVTLSRAEEELRQSRADKDNFLKSLSRIADEGTGNLENKMATELLEREQTIMKMQHVIEELKENEKQIPAVEQGLKSKQTEAAV